ncbi:MAG: SUMF1/EgtB/PvdO family nonheme iron enzyme [Myxococcota bacterium]
MSDDAVGIPERYVFRRTVGAGYNGVVHCVHDTVLRLDVAIKVMLASLIDDVEAVAGFDREACLTAQLRHPAIVPVHDRGTLDDGRCWFTMELLEGHRSVRAVLGQHDGAPEIRRDVVRTLWEVAGAVAFVHGRGVAHRRIDLDRIWIGPFGEARLVHWADAWLQVEGDRDPEGDTLSVAQAEDVRALGRCLAEVVEAGGGNQELNSLATKVTRPSAGMTAAEVRERLGAWLDHQRLRDQALESYERGITAGRAVQAVRLRIASIEDQLAESERQISTFAGVETRRAIWALQDQLDAATAEAHRLELSQVQQLRASLSSGVPLPEARQALAQIYRKRAERAQKGQDSVALSTALAQLSSVDDGAHGEWLAGLAWLTLETEPSGVPVFARKIEAGPWARRPVGTEKGLGMTPLDRVELGAGSWQLTLRRPGGYPVVLPVHLERLQHLEVRRPGNPGLHPIWLPPAESVTAEEAYVPAGWFRAGGTIGTEPWSPCELWVDAFVMRRRLVTVQEWCDFLEDLRIRGSFIDEVARPEAVVSFEGRRPKPAVNPESPFCGVSLVWAARYTAWLADRDGQPWRLPHEAEWEKASRGVDGRLYPWGDRWDVTLAANLGSGADWLDPLGRYEHDESVYGVQGMTGHLHEFCGNEWQRQPPDPSKAIHGARFEQADRHFAVRGADVLLGPPQNLASSRFATLPERVFKLGIRPVRSVP